VIGGDARLSGKSARKGAHLSPVVGRRLFRTPFPVVHGPRGIVLTLATLLLVGACGGPAFEDPANARCNDPEVVFDEARFSSSHTDIAVKFTCEGVTLAGTLAEPDDQGRHPAVVWVAGDGETPRLTYDHSELVPAFVDVGIAVLSYDKRGVGESGGECCPGDADQFNLLAADVDGAVNALRARPEIDSNAIGIVGASQAGWVAPLAAARSQNRIAFIALADAPTVSTGTEGLYSQLTGEEGGGDGNLSPEEISKRLADEGPSGFDPRPSLEMISKPGLWLYGDSDLSIPVPESEAVLDSLKANGKNFSYIEFAGAGHGLLDVPPTSPQALPTMIDWVLGLVGRSGDAGA
jgi:pimeloyl-ACP methyl ester carboxylesterase